MEHLKNDNVKGEDEFSSDFINYSENTNLEVVHNVNVQSENTNKASMAYPTEPNSSKSTVEEKKAKVLWKRMKKGNMDALGKLYDLYADELFSYGMEKVHNKTLVMDSIHDLFVSLYKYRSKVTDPTNVKYYLLKSLKREVIRKHISKKHINLEDSLLEIKKLNSGSSYEEELVEAEHLNEKLHQLKTALTYLTKRQQKVLQLKFTENRTYGEIAEIMDVSAATSRTLVYRALSVLRKHVVSLIMIAIHIIY